MKTELIFPKRWLLPISTVLIVGFVVGCGSLTGQNNSPTLTSNSTSQGSVRTQLDNQTIAKNQAELQTTFGPGDSTSNRVTTGPTAKISRQSTKQSKPVAKIATTPSKSLANNGVSISKAKFEQLKYGETYEQVKLVLGGSGLLVTENGFAGSKNYTATYLYQGKGQNGGQAFLVFQGGKLINKMEVNVT